MKNEFSIQGEFGVSVYIKEYIIFSYLFSVSFLMQPNI